MAMAQNTNLLKEYLEEETEMTKQNTSPGEKTEMITARKTNLNKEDPQEETEMTTQQNTNLNKLFRGGKNKRTTQWYTDLNTEDPQEETEMTTQQNTSCQEQERTDAHTISNDVVISKRTSPRHLYKQFRRGKNIRTTQWHTNLNKEDPEGETEMTAQQNTSQRREPTHSGLISQTKSLQCSICYKFMTEPKLLSCGHTFCLSCLSKLVRQNEVRCALCRKNTKVVDGDPSTLLNNIALRSMVEEVANLEGRCDVCDIIGKPDDIAYCRDCNIFMCPKCEKGHRGKTENDNHLVNKRKRYKHFSTLKMENKFCTYHGEDTCVGICIKCNIYVCEECSATHNNKEHDVQDLPHYATALHAKATPLKKDIKVTMEKSKLCIEQCQDNLEKTIQHIDSVMSQINGEFHLCVTELEKNRTSAIKACSDLKKRMCKLSDDFSENNVKCNSLLVKASGAIQMVLDSPFGDMRTHNSTLQSSESEINNVKTEVNCHMEKLPKMFKDGEILNFIKESKLKKCVLGKLMYHDWERTSYPLTRHTQEMTCMAVSLEGNVLVGYFSGGVQIFSGTGLERVRVCAPLSKVRVMAMSFGKDGNLVLRDKENEISIYGRALKKCDVKFETLPHSEGGDGDIALDTNNDIYASYRSTMMIHMYRKQGGKPCREIKCDGFNPQQILVMSDFDMIVMDAAKIRIINSSGTIKSEVVRKGHLGYPAIAWDGTLLIAWVKPQGHSVEIVEYTKDMKYKRKILLDNSLDLSGRLWYYCRVAGAERILFCCPKHLYIFTLHVRPLQSLADDE